MGLLDELRKARDSGPSKAELILAQIEKEQPALYREVEEALASKDSTTGQYEFGGGKISQALAERGYRLSRYCIDTWRKAHA